jgi:hypothetical protein
MGDPASRGGLVSLASSAPAHGIDDQRKSAARGGALTRHDDAVGMGVTH